MPLQRRNLNYKKNIAVIPTSDCFLGNKLFSLDFNKENRHLGHINLKLRMNKINYKINTIDMYEQFDDVDVILFERVDYTYLKLFIRKYPMVKRVLIPWEPEVVSKEHSIEKLAKLKKYFDLILTWNDDLIDDMKFIKLNYRHHLNLYSSRIPDSKEFLKKKLLVQVSSNLKSNHPFELYSLRKKLNHLSEERFGNDYSFYGSRWKSKTDSYKGVAQDKTQTISNYRFSFCLENMKNVNGYITEKIFDCFVAGVVPIYYGASNITKYIPKECFIDFRDFKDPSDLFDYLDSIKYEEWKQYLIEANKFLTGEKAYQFSIDYFINVVSEIVDNDFNREQIPRISYIPICFKAFFQIQRRRLSKIKHLLISNTRRVIDKLGFNKY